MLKAYRDVHPNASIHPDFREDLLDDFFQGDFTFDGDAHRSNCDLQLDFIAKQCLRG